MTVGRAAAGCAQGGLPTQPAATDLVVNAVIRGVTATNSTTIVVKCKERVFFPERVETPGNLTVFVKCGTTPVENAVLNGTMRNQTLAFAHVGGGAYSAVLPELPAGVSNYSLTLLVGGKAENVTGSLVLEQVQPAFDWTRFLNEKTGPLPLWAWGLLTGGVIVVVWRVRRWWEGEKVVRRAADDFAFVEALIRASKEKIEEEVDDVMINKGWVRNLAEFKKMRAERKEAYEKAEDTKEFVLSKYGKEINKRRNEVEAKVGKIFEKMRGQARERLKEAFIPQIADKKYGTTREEVWKEVKSFIDKWFTEEELEEIVSEGLKRQEQ